MLTAEIRPEGSGWMIDVHGDDWPGTSFFVGRIEFKGRSMEFWRSMAFWLAKERKRHCRDINAIDRDLEGLARMGIDAPNPSADEFVKVPE